MGEVQPLSSWACTGGMQGAAAEASKMKITICPSFSCPAAFDLQLIAAPSGIRVKKYIQETELSVDPFHL